jgi:hypothetical protein
MHYEKGFVVKYGAKILQSVRCLTNEKKRQPVE